MNTTSTLLNDLKGNKNVFTTIIPVTVMRAIKARGIDLNELFNGSNRLEQLGKLTTRELALIIAANKHAALSKALGAKDGYLAFFQDYSDQGAKLFHKVDAIFDTPDITDELNQTISGVVTPDKPSISVEHLASHVIGVIVGEGAIDALQKDNNVLEMLKSVMDIALTYGDVSHLQRTQTSRVVASFIAVNAFANTTCRPPTPVYR